MNSGFSNELYVIDLRQPLRYLRNCCVNRGVTGHKENIEMKIAILTMVSSLILFVSCKSQISGLYVGEIDSGIKHLSNSTLKLKDDNQFELVNSMTSLESTIPSTTINEITGKFDKDNDYLILFPESKKINWLTYGENPDTVKLNSNGVRKSAFVVVDTIYGQIQIIEGAEPIRFKITNKENSKYIWNNETCFVKYLNTESSNDLMNYCSELTKIKKATKDPR